MFVRSSATIPSRKLCAGKCTLKDRGRVKAFLTGSLGEVGAWVSMIPS